MRDCSTWKACVYKFSFIFLSTFIRRTHDLYLCSQWQLMLIPKLLPIHPVFSSDDELLFLFFFQQQLQGWIQGDRSEVLHLFSLCSGHSHLKWLGGEAIHSVRGPEGVWRLSVPKRQLCKPSLANWLCLSGQWLSASSQICKIYTTKKSIS